MVNTKVKIILIFDAIASKVWIMWGDTLGGSGVEEVGEATAELGVAVDLGDFDVGYELADADVFG